jgi:hypothetical protein
MANIPLTATHTSGNWNSYTITNAQVNITDILYISLTTSNVYDVRIELPLPIISNYQIYGQFDAGQTPTWNIIQYGNNTGIVNLTVTNQSAIGFGFMPIIPTGTYSMTIQTAQYS